MKTLIILLSCVLFLQLSCTTSRGTAFEESLAGTESSEQSSPAARRRDRDKEVRTVLDDQNQLTPDHDLAIESSPSGAMVFINREFRGTTPLFISNLQADRYHIELEKSGYYSQSTTIDYRSGRQQIFISLSPITGFLRLDSATTTFITIGDLRFTGPPPLLELPVGRHLVTAEEFGYRRLNREVLIQENRETILEIELQPAAFSATELRLDRRTINPQGLAYFNRLSGSFQVTAPGSGTLEILDTLGEVVYHQFLDPFTSWRQDFLIPEDKLQIPNGEYYLVLSLIGDDGQQQKLSTQFTVDSNFLVYPAVLTHGVSGRLLAPDSRVLPQSIWQIGGFIAGHIGQIDGERHVLVPLNWSARLGVGNGMELGLAVNLLPDTREQMSVPYSVGAGFKKTLTPPGAFFSSACYLSLVYGDGTDSDLLANFPGLHTGIPLALNFGSMGLPLALHLVPELVFSWKHPVYSAPSAETGFYSFGYLKSSLTVDYGIFSAALSFSIRSAPFTDGFTKGPQPFAGGFELHVVPPGTAMVLSLYSFGEASGSTDFFILGGAGLGFFF